MVTFDQWRFPDGETHLPGKMAKKNLRVDGRLTYQYPLYLEGLKHCRQRRLAADVGAHVGLFSYWMVRDFAAIEAFEPVARHRDCWVLNVPARPSDHLHACALGARDDMVRMELPAVNSTGGTFVAGRGPILMQPLDAFHLADLDLLKIDCEGYELEVVQGAIETLQRCHPVCIVEQRPKQVARFKHGEAEAVRVLGKLGARTVWTDKRDYVVAWP